jgi:hypothetical protein
MAAPLSAGLSEAKAKSLQALALAQTILSRDAMDQGFRRQLVMSSTELVTLYRRFGPVLFSHFLRTLGDENQAMKATRYAFEELLATRRTSERELVQWIRELKTPPAVAQTDSLY